MRYSCDIQNMTGPKFRSRSGKRIHNVSLSRLRKNVGVNGAVSTNMKLSKNQKLITLGGV